MIPGGQKKQTMDIDDKNDQFYVLRMNSECTYAYIEQSDLSDYPVLQEWFSNPQRYNRADNIVKERTLVGRCVGAEGIINYATHHLGLASEMSQTCRSLEDYAESVRKAGQILGGLELTDLRHERSKADMDYCSFSDTFYVYGKPFLKLVYRLGHRVKIDSIMTEYDVPCWQIDFIHSGGLSVHRGKELLNEKRSFDGWMQLITQAPEDAAPKKAAIRAQVEKVFGVHIQDKDVLYDYAAGCYLLKEEAEREVLKKLMPERDDKTEEIAKYTTLETLISVLKTGKIWMNSLVSMNDKTETDFLEEIIRNYKEEYELEFDKYLFADRQFITSFTKRIDELDMWRLYGDNARGVCMVFERKNKTEDGLFKIRYVDPDAESLQEVADLMTGLSEKGIRFRSNLLQKFRHFLKHSDYAAEEECRLLVSCEKPDGWFINRGNGILTPYIQKSIGREGEELAADNEYPFRLSRIILGPAINEMHANLMQVFYMAHQYGFSLEVQGSGINSYR